MGRIIGIKWEKSYSCRPNHNIISSDFPKYVPHPWKFMEGPPLMPLLMSNEYQRLWERERDLWSKRMYPETAENVDLVKRYVQNFMKNVKKTKPEKPKPFRMKKFEGIGSKTSTRRKPDENKKEKTKKSSE